MNTTGEIISYASRTGTRRNLAALRARGWRLLVSATGAHRTEGFPYAIDNGAWTAHQKKKPFDSRAFIRVVIALGALADWVACPDIVAGGLDSLRLSLKWLPWVLSHTPYALIPVQDGMVEADLQRDLVAGRVGIFVGGSTQWKLSTMAMWCRLAAENNVWCHVGRVNSMQRIKHCQMAGATSFDGTNATIFSKNLPKLTWAVRQRTLDLKEP